MAYSTNLTKEDEKRLAKKKVEKALAKINADVASVFDNESLPQYLRFAATFHYFDVNNCLLIYKQRPTATYVASFKTWEKLSIDQFGDANRPVFASDQKGQGIGILVPYILKKKNAQVYKGKAISYFDYHVVFVFDKEQVNEISIPVFEWDLANSPSDSDYAFNAFKEKAPFEVVFSNEDIKKNYSYSTADKGSGKRDVLTLNVRYKNEHFKLCNFIVKLFVAKSLEHLEEEFSQNEFQKIVECVSYMVSCYFGLSTEHYVFFFAKSWAHGSNQDMIKILNTIHTSAHNIIGCIEEEITYLKDMYCCPTENVFDDDIFEANSFF